MNYLLIGYSACGDFTFTPYRTYLCDWMEYIYIRPFHTNIDHFSEDNYFCYIPISGYNYSILYSIVNCLNNYTNPD